MAYSRGDRASPIRGLRVERWSSRTGAEAATMRAMAAAPKGLPDFEM
jgi:hypothetical protein